ncbi:Imidazole glycerol phosphate synthase hisHF, chloroplastic [Capsicum chinense]|nr:Imidazole glycerol phosphate synthase hisHF, chloroplastic [Capsicum chinense]
MWDFAMDHNKPLRSASVVFDGSTLGSFHSTYVGSSFPGSPFRVRCLDGCALNIASLGRTRSYRRHHPRQVVTLRDYCGGNVRSLRNAIKYLGFDIKDVQTPEDILKAKRLVFPGVHGAGAKQEGVWFSSHNAWGRNGLFVQYFPLMAEALYTYIEQDRPFLVVCLGLQLLFESSEENGPGHKLTLYGLGLIPGVVRPFDSSKGIRVPHIGWNALGIAKDTQILDDIGKSHVYFVHSYRAMPVLLLIE